MMGKISVKYDKENIYTHVTTLLKPRGYMELIIPRCV